MTSRWPLVEPESMTSTGLWLAGRHHGAVLARDVDQAVGPAPQRMRRDIGPQIDVADMRTLCQVDDGDQMAGIGIAAMDAVAEDRNIGKPSPRHHQQSVHGARKAGD